MPYADKAKKHARQTIRRKEIIERRTFCCMNCDCAFRDRVHVADHQRSCVKRSNSMGTETSPMNPPTTQTALENVLVARPIDEGIEGHSNQVAQARERSRWWVSPVDIFYSWKIF